MTGFLSLMRKEIKNGEPQRFLYIGQVLVRFIAAKYGILRKLFDGAIVSDPALIQLLTTIFERGRHGFST